MAGDSLSRHSHTVQEATLTSTDATASVPRRRPKDRKQQILVQARQLFVDLGYHNVSMAMIADKVGITAGALYRHFGNKVVLLEEVARASFAEVEIPDLDRTTLEEALERATETAPSTPYLGALWSRELRYLPDDVRTELREVLRAAIRQYAALLLRERPELSVRQADLIASGLQSVLASPSYAAVRRAGPRLPSLLRAAAHSLATMALVPEGEAVSAAPPGRAPSSRRERLLIAATELFAAKGYQETSMADIGAVASVTGPNLYGYFDSKAALLQAVVERATHALWIDLDRAFAENRDPRDALQAVVHGYVRITAGWSLISVHLSGEEEVERVARRHQREYVAEWLELVVASRPGVDQQSASALVHVAFALCDELSRTPHLAAAAGFRANLESMVMAVLLVPAAPSGNV